MSSGLTLNIMRELFAVLEFVRLADMTGAGGMEDMMSRLINSILLKSLPPPER